MNSLLVALASNAVVAALLFGLVLILKRWIRQPAVLHALLLMVLAKLVTPTIWTLPVGLPWLSETPASAAAEVKVHPIGNFVPEASASEYAANDLIPAFMEGTRTHEADAPGIVPDSEDVPIINAVSPAAADDTTAQRSAIVDSLSKANWLGVVWLIGTCAWLFLAVWRIQRFRSCLRNAELPSPELAALVDALASKLDLKRRPRLCIVSANISPMLWSLGGRSQLILPKGLLTVLNRDELRAVVLHELVHYRRGDHWVRLVEFFATGLYWWYPVVWWLRREIRTTEELCCDAWVVDILPSQRRAYAEALVKTISSISQPAPVYGGTGMAGKHDLEQRLKQIMLNAFGRGLPRHLKAGLACFAAAVLIVSPTWDRSYGQSTDQEPNGAKTQTGNESATTTIAQIARSTGETQTSAPSPAVVEGQDQFGDPLPRDAQLRLGTIRLRQRQGVMGVTFSPDGKYLASCGWGDSIRFWDVNTGRQVRRLKVSGGEGTFAVGFSSDGKKLASVGENGFVRLWDLTTGEAISERQGHLENGYGVRTYGVVFSPDGSTFATAGEDPSVRLWDAGTGEELLELQCAEGGQDAHPVAFSPDGNFLATCTKKGTIYIWNLAEGGDPTVIEKAHARDIASVVFAPDGKHVISSGSRHGRTRTGSSTTISEIHEWDILSGEKIGSFQTEENLLGDPTLALFADGQRLASAHYQKIVIWDLKSHKPVQMIDSGDTHNGGRTHGVAVSPDGKLVASKGRDHKVYVWNIATGKPVLEPENAHTYAVLSAQFSPDGTKILTGSGDATARLWDAVTGEHIRLVSQGSGWNQFVEFFPGGERIAVGATTHNPNNGNYEGEVKIWRAADGQVIHHFTVPDRVVCGAVSANGRFVAVATGLGMSFDLNAAQPCKIYVWDSQSGKRLAEMSGHGNQIRQVMFASDDGVLWSVSDDQSIRKWDITTGKETDRRDLPREERSRGFREALFTRSAEGIVLGELQGQSAETLKGRLTFRNLETGTPLWETLTPDSWPAALAISPDEKILAVFHRALGRSSINNRIALCSAETGRELLNFEIEDGSVRSLAFSPDDKRLVSGMDRGDALVWDISATHQQ